MSVFTSTKRDAWVVISITEAAVKSGTWTRGLSSAVATASQLVGSDPLLQGWIVDYEPADNYTLAHAEDYGAFLGGLAAALKPTGIALAMVVWGVVNSRGNPHIFDPTHPQDIAGWGILSSTFWPAFKDRGLARFTSMTPTYDGHNVTENKIFVQQVRVH